MKEETENKSVKDTMEIILHAGDAREFIADAIDNVADYDYSKAEENMRKAEAELVIAHRLQTAKIQQEAEGKKVPYSVLFTHAQDTLMTINSEFKLIQHLIKVFKARDKREGRI